MVVNTEVASLLKSIEQHFGSEQIKDFYTNAVFIVSAPRSGSTLLFQTLKKGLGFWSIGGESHNIFEAFPHLEAENDAFDSGGLTQAHADEETARMMRAAFLYSLQDRDGHRYINLQPAERPGKVCFLEKTPRNALNIPFLLKVFPHAKFIFLHREAKQNIGSIIDAWAVGEEKGVFVTFRNLPDWDRKHWCLLLPTGWRSLKGKSISQIAAFQWRLANQTILDELEKLPKERWMALSYTRLTASPASEIKAICDFSGVEVDNHLKQLVADKLPLSNTTVSQPDPNKWMRYQAEILEQLPSCLDIISRLENLDSAR